MQINTFITLGRPGSGKGTQGNLLAQKIGGKVYSSGKEFRELAAGERYLGRHLKMALDAGELMPTWLASYLHQKTLFNLEPEDKIVLEGTCRIKPEAELFHEVVAWLERPYRVVYLEVSEDEMVRRLRKRLEVDGRADDAEKSIPVRIQEFNTKTVPTIEFFRSVGVLVSVNGEGEIEKVHQDVSKALGLL